MSAQGHCPWVWHAKGDLFGWCGHRGVLAHTGSSPAALVGQAHRAELNLTENHLVRGWAPAIWFVFGVDFLIPPDPLPCKEGDA